MGRQLRRVPLDFVPAIGEVWGGFLNPHYDGHRRTCTACDGSGYSPKAALFKDQWYGNAPFDPVAYGARPLTVDHPGVVAFATRNFDADPGFYLRGLPDREAAIDREASRLFDHWKGQWGHHLIQADVDALVAADRLWDFTRTPRDEAQRETVRANIEAGGNSWLPRSNGYVPSADAVNDWSLAGMGHDSLNCGVCVQARCRREGVDLVCGECNGDGSVWDSEENRRLAEEWEPTGPPTGEGWSMWETVSEGSPISPVFATPEELAAWLADNDRDTATYPQWLKFILGTGWAMSGVMVDGVLSSGVAAMADDPKPRA